LTVDDKQRIVHRFLSRLPSHYMTTRRQFLVHAPLGVAGVVSACRNGSPADDAAANSPPTSAPVTQAGAVAGATTQPLLEKIPLGAPVLQWTPKHEELVYTFGGATPRQRIKSGTRIITWTEDCFDGAVKTAADLPSKKMPPGHDNPQTGPFHIEGAEPGDTVAVHILKLEPARGYGVSSFGPGFGALVGTDKTAMLGPDFPETTWRYDIDAAKGTAGTTTRDGKHRWDVPMAPFLGCIGVAPAGGEVRTTIVPGNFGGNMDCPEARAGNTVFLGVNVPGAMLSFGDGHYAMGEGEIMGAAIEGAMNVEVYVELLKKAGDAGSTHRERERDHFCRLRSSARGRGARSVQSDDRLGATRNRHVGARRLPVRVAELQGANHSTCRPRIHCAREARKITRAEIGAASSQHLRFLIVRRQRLIPLF
jgi:acetamidase/formamidase